MCNSCGRHTWRYSAIHRVGPALAVKWSSGARPAEAIDAYMHLPLAKSALEAEGILEKAHTLSLHFVLADRDGDIRYCQAGFIPKRTEGWSGQGGGGYNNNGWRNGDTW